MFTKIDELLWTDEKFKKLSDDGKFLFLYVLSCPHRNILGFYFLPIPYGSFDLDWKSERFTKGLQELLDKGLINYNFDTNIIFIKNFLKYNPLENPNQVKGAIKALNTLPTNSIDTELVSYLETINKPFIKPLLELLRERLGEHVDVDVDVDVKEDVDETKKTKAPTKIKYGEFEKVKLSEEEHIKLLDKLGQTLTDDLIVRLDSYKASTGKTYKSDYATILNWSRKESKENGPRNNVTEFKGKDEGVAARAGVQSF